MKTDYTKSQLQQADEIIEILKCGKSPNPTSYDLDILEDLESRKWINLKKYENGKIFSMTPSVHFYDLLKRGIFSEHYSRNNNY